MRRHRSAASLLTGLVALSLVLAGCSGDSGSSENGTGAATLNVNAGGFPESWAPGQRMEAGFLRLPYETLVAKSRDGKFSPVLATEWEESDKALTLTLREGVKFHDGTAFNAAAVKANLEFVRDGATAFGGPLKVITSIDTPDEKTVTLNLARPTPSLLTTLSTRATPMASPAALKDGSIAKKPIGTSPWAYDEAASTPGTNMVFTTFKDYWDGTDAVAYDTVKLFNIDDENAAAGALTSGQVDVTIAQPEQLKQFNSTPGIETVEYPAIRNNVIFFDRGTGGAFADVRVRQAACSAMDNTVAAKLISGKPATQHFAEGELGYNSAIAGYPHDVAKAKQLISQAGNPKVSGTILAAPFNRSQIEVYADQMADAGITIKVQTAAPPQFQSEWNSGKYPLGMGNNDQIHPYEWYKAYFAADAPGNPSKSESPALKAAADKAIAAGSSPEAEALWGEVTKVIADEALSCTHVVSNELIAYQSNKVEGVDIPAEAWEPNLINYRDLKPASGAAK
ncbi:ABC transporter substrate-binding protein [Cryptosporangium aurantiacum]|uniref:Peptide/nickel transport system substrate-binding protein n=1 Tax=Cryptosporangium aurantiacum TaxID=134849 RepID=A0A1M7TZA2_9ACTN|nr:ABC transporter substrate-binding protein [Cryptosporangium aurantiacum]SHN76015.1 peptide/nickel transport system substrate-binding protein [Cryptosporangium aurantiacum]